jgi:hypothetical protein
VRVVKKKFLLLQSRLFVTVCQLKSKFRKKNGRFGIYDWWNYLMNSLYILTRDVSNFDLLLYRENENNNKTSTETQEVMIRI